MDLEFGPLRPSGSRITGFGLDEGSPGSPGDSFDFMSRVLRRRSGTWVVPAASGRAASPPLSLVQGGAPLLQLAFLQSIRCQVADLQPGELAQEVAERHPE